MRVALVHHWLITMRGGEKVLESLSEMFPHSDIFTLFYREEGISAELNKHRITASVLNYIPLSHRFYPNYSHFIPWPVAHWIFEDMTWLYPATVPLSRGFGSRRGHLTYVTAIRRPDTCGKWKTFT